MEQQLLPEQQVPAIQPWSPDSLQGLSKFGAFEAEAGGGFEDHQMLDEDDDSWAFWQEQKRPTKGARGQDRVRPLEPLPDPLPSLQGRVQASDEGFLDDDFGDDESKPDLGTDFHRAYQTETVVVDLDGSQLTVPELKTFEEAVDRLGFPPFLQANLARKEFWRLTPVQEATMPLVSSGQDFLASSFTGSGKTAAYLLPILASLHQLSRLVPGTLVAAHYKLRSGDRSEKPIIGRVRGMRGSTAAIEFQREGSLVSRQLIPPEWVVGLPKPPPRGPWKGPVTPAALVLVPTRELCEQVHEQAVDFTRYSSLRSAALYGNSSTKQQFRNLAPGADILVATPGRLIDALHRGIVKLERVKHLVLDETDRMMEYGFGNQLEEITEQAGLPTSASGRQTSFWSATIPPSVRDLVEAFLGQSCMWVDCTGGVANPVPGTIRHILVDARPLHRTLRRMDAGTPVFLKGGLKGTAGAKVGNRYKIEYMDGPIRKTKLVKKGNVFLGTLHTEHTKRDKLELLEKVLGSKPLKKATVIVFCRRREVVEEVYRYLKEKFVGVVVCHGGMTEKFRMMSIAALRDGKADILVASDVAARGLDVPSVSHVVNYELPSVVDEFVHRCGRTGRIGKRGHAITFVNGREPIFRAMRRCIRQQGQRTPEWFHLKGMQLAWRPKWHKPFEKSKDDSPTDDDIRREIKRRQKELIKYQTKRMDLFSRIANGEVKQEAALRDLSEQMVIHMDEDDPNDMNDRSSYVC